MASPAYSARSHTFVNESEATKEKRIKVWEFAAQNIDPNLISLDWIRDKMVRTKRNSCELAKGLASRQAWKGSEAQKTFVKIITDGAEEIRKIEAQLLADSKIF
jgi:hypothetical protein